MLPQQLQQLLPPSLQPLRQELVRQIQQLSPKVPHWVSEVASVQNSHIEHALKTIQRQLTCPDLIAHEPLEQQRQERQGESRGQTSERSRPSPRNEQTHRVTRKPSSAAAPSSIPAQQPQAQELVSAFPKGVQVGSLCSPTSLPDKRAPRKSPYHRQAPPPQRQQVQQCLIDPEAS